MNWMLVLKIVTGIVVVPVTVAANASWNWWQHAPRAMKIITAPVVLPLVGFSIVTTFWWEGLKS